MLTSLKCRNCKTKNVKKVFDLGELYYTGKFPSNKKIRLGKGELGLSFCKNCTLVQLNKSYNTNYLFSKDYGYKTGVNFTMRNHMKNIHDILTKKIKLKKDDYIMDIASNDGTLLNLFNNNLNKVGVDPILSRYREEYKKVKYKISNFFSEEVLKKNKINKKFKVITALSVFYDLDNPNNFLKDIEKVLDDNGICLIEHADLYSIIKFNMFDTICHEHVAYYSTQIMINMAKKNNLKVFDLKSNDINGGSTQYFICKKNANLSVNHKALKKYINKEKVIGVSRFKTIVNFYKKIKQKKISTIKLLISLRKKNKKIYGYGASTKGNVLLQYYGIDNQIIPMIADRNPYKYGRFTPGSLIKIVSEKTIRKLKPDYFFVLPWHFKKEIIQREKPIRKKGTKFIFPLPNLRII